MGIKNIQGDAKISDNLIVCKSLAVGEENKPTVITLKIQDNHEINFECFTGAFAVDWGDERFDKLDTLLQHEYLNRGEYTCKIFGAQSVNDTTVNVGLYNHNELMSVEIGNSVESIGSFAFQQCFILTNVVISESVSNIGSHAFYYCDKLTNITFKSTTPISYVKWFIMCPSLTHIYVPYDCAQAYIDKWRADGAPEDILSKIVESDREAMMSDLGEYVKSTDYATSEKAGLIKYGAGLKAVANGMGVIDKASNEMIKAKTDVYRPIVSASNDYAWKVSATTNTEIWTDEEKAAACETIGAVRKRYLGAGHPPFAYGFSEYGEEMFAISQNPYLQGIPYYGQSLCIRSNTPIQSLDCANKDYVDNLPDNLTLAESEQEKWREMIGALQKVDVSEDESPQVYASTPDGQQMIPVEAGIKTGGIPRYSNSGRLQCRTPIEDSDCANREFVENLPGYVTLSADSQENWREMIGVPPSLIRYKHIITLANSGRVEFYCEQATAFTTRYDVNIAAVLNGACLVNAGGAFKILGQTLAYVGDNPHEYCLYYMGPDGDCVVIAEHYISVTVENV